MKTNINWLKHLVMFALGFGIFISSCSKNDLVEVEDSSTSILKSVQIGACDLIAGQHMDAGMVSYEIVGNEIIVTYETDGWFLSEVHLFVGEEIDLPSNKKGIKVGQFTVSIEGLEGITSKTFTLPFDVEWENPILAAHAVVFDGLGNEETAWANCGSSIITSKAWFKDVSGARLWAVTDGILAYQEIENYCQIMGINSFVNGDYDFITETNGKVGTLNILDGIVTIIPDEGFRLCESYVYVGSFEDIPMFSYGCPNYYNFFYQIANTCSITPHVYEITEPQSESISFEALGSSRWGWFMRL